jgi:diguanylate cyclase (GGDEF)-like protein
MTSNHIPELATTASQRAGHGKLRRLAWIVLFVLPVLAYNFAVHIMSGAGASGPGSRLSSQAVLLAAALLVPVVGAFLMWRTAISMAQATEIEARLQYLDGGLADRLDENAPLANSFVRMLATIERQRSELDQFAQRLRTTEQELEAAKARLEEVSFTDELTKLYNRRFLSLRLEQEVGRYRRFGRPFSLVVLDMDGLARVNAELGWLAGDETLRGVAELLLKNSRAIDLITRHGGDEFAVLLVDASAAEASAYVERMRDLLSSCSFGHGRELTACFGTASFPEDAAAAEDLVRGAEQSLEVAKRGGKDRVVAYAAPDHAGELAREAAVR